MKKPLIYLKLLGLALLLLSAMSAAAQKGLEYWIDDYSNHKLIYMPAVEGNLRAKIHVEDLSPGLHTIFMRSVSPDGTYSPITSSPFIKIESSGGTKLDMWLDDDMTKVASLPLEIDPETGTELKFKINFNNIVADFPFGTHKLSMRVHDDVLGYGAVYSANFMHLPEGGSSKITFWLDDDMTKTASFPVSIPTDTVADVNFKLDFNNIIDNFPLGSHKLSMRLYDERLGYGSVYSSNFTHLPQGGSSNITFWFDGDMTKMASYPITIGTDAATEATFQLALNNIIAKCPFGSHEVSMRLYDDKLGYGAVYSSNFTHMPQGGSSNITFWLDGDMSKKVTFPINMNLEAVQKKELNLNSLLAENPYGSHELSMRLYDDKLGYGAVYNSNVLHLRHGDISHLEYWLNDDYANRRTLNAKTASGKVSTFDNYINLSALPAGVYYMKYRVPPSGAVYETAVLLDQRYYNTLNVYIEKEGRWFDNNEPSYFNTTGPHVVTYTNSYVLDPANFSPGQHELHLQYMNSAGVWSEQNVTYFYKGSGSKLYIGFMPDETDDITDVPIPDEFYCFCEEGIVTVDCRSPRLGESGEVMVYDLMGRLIAHRAVSNMGGIHAELDVSAYASNLLIVRLVSGAVNISRKIMFR